jgi:hypothetical protein
MRHDHLVHEWGGGPQQFPDVGNAAQCLDAGHSGRLQRRWHMDVVWKNTSTGQIVGWALNATQQRTATTPSPPAWPHGGLGEKSEE